MQEDGRTLPDGTHELIVHKVQRWNLPHGLTHRPVNIPLCNIPHGHTHCPVNIPLCNIPHGHTHRTVNIPLCNIPDCHTDCGVTISHHNPTVKEHALSVL